MKLQNYLYLSKLKKTKADLEKSLSNLEQYDQDEESIRLIALLKNRIKAKQNHINFLKEEIKKSKSK